MCVLSQSLGDKTHRRRVSNCTISRTNCVISSSDRQTAYVEVVNIEVRYLLNFRASKLTTLRYVAYTYTYMYVCTVACTFNLVPDAKRQTHNLPTLNYFKLIVNKKNGNDTHWRQVINSLCFVKNIAQYK